ncbi:MAG: hypothetical protein R3D25_04625 [Geminicoccaceae bacterium]
MPWDPGPRWSSTRVVEVEATDVIRVTIAAGAGDRKVELQPGDAMQLLLINPESPADTLSYATSAGASGATCSTSRISWSARVPSSLLGGSSARPPTFQQHRRRGCPGHHRHRPRRDTM